MSNTNCCANLLSQSECCEILKKAAGDVDLLKYVIRPVSNNVVGFLGEYYKLLVTYRKENNEICDISFFVKSLPLSNELQRKEINSLGFMKKESVLYSSLFVEMEPYSSFNWHPVIYLRRDDVLVLEDLAQSNYTHECFNYNSPPKYIRAVLECMAAMHANSIVYEVKTGTIIGSDYANCVYESSVRRENSWIIAGLQAIQHVAKHHPNLQSEEHQNFIDMKLMPRLECIFGLQPSFQKYRRTFCHRDLWEKNIFYTKAPEDLRCLLIDFQIACYCPPGVDVLFFLYLNTSRSNRKENLQDYLDYYYNCLEKFTAEFQVNVQDHVTREEFDASCKEYKSLVLTLTGIYTPVVFLPEGYLGTMKMEDPKRYHRLMHVNRNDFVLECIEKFRDAGVIALDAIEELVEYLFNECVLN